MILGKSYLKFKKVLQKSYILNILMKRNKVYLLSYGYVGDAPLRVP